MMPPAQARLKRNSQLTLLWVAMAVAAGMLIWWVVFYAPSPSQDLLDSTLITLEEEVRNSPQDPDRRIAVAIAYAERGLHKEAIDQFEQALALDPENQTAMIGIGRSQIHQGDTDNALVVLQSVIDKNIDNPLLKTSEQIEAVFYEIGGIYMEQEDYPAAIENLRSAIEINPVDADAWLLLGQVQFADGNLQEALVSLLQAVRLVPNYIDAYEVMGDIFGQMGSESGVGYASGMVLVSKRDYEQAVPKLEVAILGLSDFSSAFEGLGLAYEGVDNTQGATAAYERALALDPALILARQGLLRMQGGQ